MATTQQGLRKLGDTVGPKMLDNEIRAVLHLVQAAGTSGVEIGQLASHFYSKRGTQPGRMSLDEALRCLLDTRDIVEHRGRYYAGSPELDLSTETIRSLLVLLQPHPAGLTLEELAAAFYGQKQRPGGSFEESLDSLLRVGDVVEENGRLRATAAVQSYVREGNVSLETVLAIVNTTARVGDAVARGMGAKTAGLWRVTVSIPEGEEAGRSFLMDLRNALAGAIDHAERDDSPHVKQSYTVVLGAAPSIL